VAAACYCVYCSDVELCKYFVLYYTCPFCHCIVCIIVYFNAVRSSDHKSEINHQFSSSDAMFYRPHESLCIMIIQTFWSDFSSHYGILANIGYQNWSNYVRRRRYVVCSRLSDELVRDGFKQVAAISCRFNNPIFGKTRLSLARVTFKPFRSTFTIGKWQIFWKKIFPSKIRGRQVRPPPWIRYLSWCMRVWQPRDWLVYARAGVGNWSKRPICQNVRTLFLSKRPSQSINQSINQSEKD